jgi:hypothetical protein
VRAVADQIAAAIDRVDAELVDAGERRLQRRQVGVDVGDHREASCHDLIVRIDRRAFNRYV